MLFIDFRDTCVIKRATGEKDEWDNPVRVVVYEGPCLYQEGGGYAYWYSPVFTRTPVVFLPDDYEGLIQINDAVFVTTQRGRQIEATIKVVRDISLDRVTTKQKVTRIELKQAQGE